MGFEFEKDDDCWEEIEQLEKKIARLEQGIPKLKFIKKEKDKLFAIRHSSNVAG